MALELKDATSRCEFLEKDNKTRAVDLYKALQEAREARSESRAAREEIRQAGEIATGKPFLLQTKLGDLKYAPLNQMWSSPDTFLDLPKSVSDATQFFQAQEGHATEKLFWSQFSMPKSPLLLNEQMAQWAELHKISGSAMKDVVVRFGRRSQFRIVISVWCSDLLMRCRVSTPLSSQRALKVHGWPLPASRHTGRR